MDEQVRRHIAKTQYRKFETNIPRKGIVRPQSQFPHSCVCERFMYSYDGSAYNSAAEKICGPILGKYKSITDTWKWKLGLRPCRTHPIQAGSRRLLRSSQPQEICQPPQQGFLSVHAQLQLLGYILRLFTPHITSHLILTPNCVNIYNFTFTISALYCSKCSE